MELETREAAETGKKGEVGRPSNGRFIRNVVRELIETVILALLIFLGLQFSVQNFRVEGSSMEPTLVEGQYLLVNKIVYLRFDPRDLQNFLPFIDSERTDTVYPFHGPSRGEVIIFHYPLNPSRDFVKRVIGLPGDIVEIDRGVVSVNGVELDEPYVTHPDRRSMSEFVVPENSYFVLGDNRRASNDSRDWGEVP
ncbi:MAG: signal peptidase I, partial [Chloroflexi bacterium]|nr:signal peptidase I [Chloroflexota bacterium]